MDLLTTLLFINLIGARDVRLEVIVKHVHGVRVRVEDLDVVDVIVAETFLNLVKQLEAVLKLLIQLHMVNCLLHLCNFLFELVFLVLYKLIKGVTALSQGNLEVNLRKLELLLVAVHPCGKVLIEVHDIGDDLAHLVDRVVHVVDGVRVERFRLELASLGRGRHLVLHD